MSACKKRWSLGNPPPSTQQEVWTFQNPEPRTQPHQPVTPRKHMVSNPFSHLLLKQPASKGSKKKHIITWLASSCISACFNWSKRLDVISSSSSWTSETLVLARDTGVDIGTNCYTCLKTPISFNLLLLIDLSMEILEETSLGLNLHIGHDFSHDHLRISDLHGLKLHRRWPVSQESRIYRPEFFKQGHICQ